MWLLVGVVFCVSISLFNVLGAIVDSRISANQNNNFAKKSDPDAASTVQVSPTVEYLTEKTYKRSLTIPPALLKKINIEGINVLSPYLDDTSSENVIRIRDSFWRSGKQVVFTRKTIMNTYSKIRLEKSIINVDLHSVKPNNSASNSYYNAKFNAVYEFNNPLDTAVDARFVLPLPSGSVTLSDFKIVVDGVELPVSELESGWQGRLLPRQNVRVEVQYNHAGTRGWSYKLGSRRESIRDFSLTIKSNQEPKFDKHGLYPTKIDSNSLGFTTTWDIKNIITSQDVSLNFPISSVRESVRGLYAFLPIYFLIMTVFSIIWTILNKFKPSSFQVMLSMSGVVAGTVLGAMLMSYISIYLAGVIGVLISIILAIRVLGIQYALPVGIGLALPLTAFSYQHTGLIVAIVGVVVTFVMVTRFQKIPMQQLD